MAKNTMISQIWEWLSLIQVDDNVFIGTHLYKPLGARGVYGGQIFAQALVAGARTVSKTQRVNSMHGYFLLGGDASKSIVYVVHRLRDGRSYSTRRIDARQNGKIIFTAIISFHARTETSKIAHQVNMPATDPPENFPDTIARSTQLLSDPRLTDDERESIKIRMQDTNLLDIRYLRRVDVLDPVAVAARQFVWFRVLPEALVYQNDSSSQDITPSNKFSHVIQRNTTVDSRMTTTNSTQTTFDSCSDQSFFSNQSNQQTNITGYKPIEICHCADQAIIAYASDLNLLYTSMLPHKWPNDHVRMMTSLDHSIWFHDTTDQPLNSWWLYELESPALKNGRGYSLGKIYNQYGTYIASTAQEGVVRASEHISSGKASSPEIEFQINQNDKIACYTSGCGEEIKANRGDKESNTSHSIKIGSSFNGESRHLHVNTVSWDALRTSNKEQTHLNNVDLSMRQRLEAKL